ncbi:universal stress protein [Streptomyces luteolifulvus]|uniref:Universal stress protein n=1 Tax=Streptomyces luteolifulvus TaxID=2615112 RepID=A0A6H9UPT0_9ACTN|nr:universal stress protein [Streptomyces luteolifulvus]KAB1140086.1 universal stress protein [Streptomyces luteolifulvus]
MVRYVAAGVDGSPESLAAAHWAAREALRRGAALQLIHAWKWYPRPPASVPMGSTQRGWAEQTLDEAGRSVRAAHPGLNVVGRLETGSAVDALLASEPELLVLGSRGIGGVAGFIIGSVSQRVVARSARPVVLVRARETAADEHLPALDGVSPEEIPEIPFRDVVLGLDTGQPCDELIEFAFEAARRCGAGLRVVHAYSVPPYFDTEIRTGKPSGPEILAAQERSVIATLRPWCEKFPGVLVVESVVEGRAASELVRASYGASLVVVGRRIRDSRLGTHIGPVTHAALHHVRCPVAVVPHT